MLTPSLLQAPTEMPGQGYEDIMEDEALSSDQMAEVGMEPHFPLPPSMSIPPSPPGAASQTRGSHSAAAPRRSAPPTAAARPAPRIAATLVPASSTWLNCSRGSLSTHRRGDARRRRLAWQSGSGAGAAAGRRAPCREGHNMGRMMRAGPSRLRASGTGNASRMRTVMG